MAFGKSLSQIESRRITVTINPNKPDTSRDADSYYVSSWYFRYNDVNSTIVGKDDAEVDHAIIQDIDSYLIHGCIHDDEDPESFDDGEEARIMIKPIEDWPECPEFCDKCWDDIIIDSSWYSASQVNRDLLGYRSGVSCCIERRGDIEDYIEFWMELKSGDTAYVAEINSWIPNGGRRNA